MSYLPADLPGEQNGVRFGPKGRRPRIWRPGDFFLTHGGGAVSAAIRLGTSSLWDHAGLIVTPEGGTVEAVTSGVRPGALVAYAGRPLVVATLGSRLSPRERRAAVEFARSQVGKRYGFLEIASLLLVAATGTRLRFGREGSWICSGLVGEALERAGQDLGRQGAYCTPGDLARRYGLEGLLVAGADGGGG